ncbi:uncharacterized protein LOC18775582 [Prunus persica]|uniref:uncharacterized protein LOC18775582 n=1 Tax=Prunus persica TaxID=3760 RepID=UPI0009AB2975|nr:uncharacterized protein LOC18775582 [Prunus persica]
MSIPEDEDEINQIICVTARLIEIYYMKYIHKTPCMNDHHTGNIWLMGVLQGNESRCHNMFKMDKDVFIRLCDELQKNYGLKGSRRMSAAEMLGMFLNILGHGSANRQAQDCFQHSGETMSRYFSILLDVVCCLAVDVIKPLESAFNNTLKEILPDSRYMPYFKDCIGAIDGVLVQAMVSLSNQIPFIGKSYLVDKGYPQMRGYLGPSKGERYHLPDFRRGVQPMGHKERWSILRDMPSYLFAKQVKIVIATMALHNYIKRHAKRDCHFDESEDDLNGIQGEEIEIDVDAQQEDGPATQEMEALRNHIAASLMSSST